MQRAGSFPSLGAMALVESETETDSGEKGGFFVWRACEWSFSGV